MKLVFYILFSNCNDFKCGSWVYFFFWGKWGGFSTLDILAKCLFNVWALSNGCISMVLLFFKGGWGSFCF